MKPLSSLKHRISRRIAHAAASRPAQPFRFQTDRPGSPAEPEPLPPFEWTSILDRSPEPAFVHDADQRVLRCNPAYAAKAGLPMAEIVGKPYWQVLPRLPSQPPPCALDSAEGALPILATEDGLVLEEHKTAAVCPAGKFWYCRHLLEDITVRRHLEQALAREKAVVDAIIETAPNTFFLANAEGGLVRWNSYVRRLTGLPDEQLQGASLLSFVHPDDRALVSAKLLTAVATGSTQMEARVVGEGGRPCDFLSNLRRVTIDGVPYVAGFCIDISRRKRAERALEEQKAFLDALVENIPGVFCVLDPEGNFLRWNSNLNKLTGLSDDELHKRNSLLTIAEEDRVEAAHRLQEAFEGGYVRSVLHVVSPDRGKRAYLMTGRRFEMEGSAYVVGVGMDTTEQIAAIEALEHEARIDGLTQIPNRGCFLRRAIDEFSRSRRYGHPLAFWIVDLDHFKAVNDSYGHQAGDAVLRAFVDIAHQVLRDWDFIGRLGGEEFGVLLPETGSQQALLAAERLRQAVGSTPIPLGEDQAVAVTVSIGVATMEADDGDAHALLARADAALYAAKNTGRDKVALADRAPAD
ncbi:MAG TPA: diguanylate cyclase [Rhodocyclaceae bacterium]